MPAFLSHPDVQLVLWAVIKMTVILFGVLTVVSYLILAERKLAGRMQMRFGPNRVGPFGLLQPVADVIKLFFKEEFIPAEANKVIFHIAPMLAVLPALITFSVIPIGPNFVVTDINVGLLLFLAMSSIGVYAVVLAGWSSNNKYALIGGLRSSAQMISYELALGLAVISVLVLSGTLRPTAIVLQQAESWWNVVYLPLGFLLLLISGFAETNRLPFDLPEAESELVGGYHTEYSSMKFSMFFMAEYLNMIVSACLLVTLFLGGYAVPGFIRDLLGLSGNWLAAAEVATFFAKVFFFLWLFVWVRWTLPRFRFDQLMHIGWKILIPLGFLNVIWAALLVVWGVRS